MLRRRPEILYGLGNLIENAADFARSQVRVSAEWSSETISVTVEDDGPGFPPDIISRLGEPYVTTRPDVTRSMSADGTPHEGLGLGLFIAKTLLERTGASIDIGNIPGGEGRSRGARVRIGWSRPSVESGGGSAAVQKLV